MRIYDLSRPLFREDIVYPGDMVPSCRQEIRGQYRISEVHVSSHSGTHADAPAHYLSNGKTVDEIELTTLVGRCRVVDVEGAGNRITAADLQQAVAGTERLLLRTAFCRKYRFDPDYPHLSPDAAQLVTRHGIRCIGIDSPSIESFHSDGVVHRELLRHDCIILELLDLSEVPEGEYLLAALPLNLTGADGAPARVILIDRDGEPQ